MFQAILSKEILKIKYIYLGLLLLLSCSMIYLYFDIVKSFFAIEPHSMKWYEAIFIGNIYYDILKFIPALCAIVLALSQFLPEVHKKKFKIALHLPINQNKMLLLYITVGIFLLSLINTLFLAGLYISSSSFYTNLITISALKNSIPWIIASYIIYNGLVSVMIEPYWKRKSFLIVLFTLLASMLFLNKEYEAYNNVLFLYIFILILSFFIPLLSLYRFKNGNTNLEENHSLISKIAISIIVLFSFIILSFFLPKIYKDLIHNDSLGTYVFYSSKNKEFVYKKHFGEHKFIYGNSKGDTLNQKAFEDSLPFVYWRNLDIQKKLPITINNEVYTKAKIKKARQSFKIDYRDLKENKNQIDLYPLFNPSSKKGMIAFPNMMFNLENDFLVYESEENILDKTLSNKYSKIFKENNFLFPAKIIAGKTTNIKPLDEGYFILDSKDDLFHMKVFDNKMKMNQITYDKNIKIKNIKISESRKKEFYGVLLDEKGELFIISYDNYTLKSLALQNYDSKRMKLEIYANPINKLVRYQDKQNIYALAFDKDFNLLDTYKTDIPQINEYYKDVFSYLFPFIIERNEYKTYEGYNFKINSYKAFILSFIFAFIYFLLFRKKNFLSTIIKSILILIGGIYALFFITFI